MRDYVEAVNTANLPKLKDMPDCPFALVVGSGPAGTSCRSR